MPYIPLEERDKFTAALLALESAMTKDSDLSYCLARLCVLRLGDNPRWEDYKNLVGTLETWWREFVENTILKCLDAYEMVKKAENGGVL